MATKATAGTLEKEGGEGGTEKSRAPGLGTSVALAWGCIRSDERVLLLGLVQSLFEGATFTFGGLYVAPSSIGSTSTATVRIYYIVYIWRHTRTLPFVNARPGLFQLRNWAFFFPQKIYIKSFIIFCSITQNCSDDRSLDFALL